MNDDVAESLNLNDPDFAKAVNYSMNALRIEIAKLDRSSDMTSSVGRTQLEWIEQRLGPYSYVKMFRRHMTLARETMRDGVRYLKRDPKKSLVPVIAARCAIENAGIARWVSEASPKVIVERVIERELGNIADEQRMMGLFGGDATKYTKRKNAALLEYVAENDIDLSEITTKKGELRPSTLTSIMNTIDAHYEAPDDGAMYKPRSPWSLSSAIIHGSEYPGRILDGLTIKDDHGQLIGIHPLVLSGFLEAAKNTYQEAMKLYQNLYLTNQEKET
ncbi:hypothetical protein [Brevibacterium sp. FAM 24630]|uniref:hypothetical protein n=1 Tax=Brevibacterium sp. FAM 24630 TaxID=3415680 RepID=UPI003C7D2917